MPWWQALGRYVNIWDRLDNLEQGMTTMASDIDQINADLDTLSNGMDAFSTELTAIGNMMDAEQARVGQAVDLSAIRARLDGLVTRAATLKQQADAINADHDDTTGQAPTGTVPAPATADTSTAADPASGTATTTTTAADPSAA